VEEEDAGEAAEEESTIDTARPVFGGERNAELNAELDHAADEGA